MHAGRAAGKTALRCQVADCDLLTGAAGLSLSQLNDADDEQWLDSSAGAAPARQE
jgi:hypothetical protein